MLILTLIKKLIVFYHIFAKYNFYFFGFYGSIYCSYYAQSYWNSIKYHNYNEPLTSNLVLSIIFYCILYFLIIYVIGYHRVFRWQKWHDRFFIKPIYISFF